jgi:tRNA(Ile)-lysidine synthase
MWEKALNSMEQYRHQTIFVGCSGGVDSMVLVHFLHKNNFTIHVLHVNYQKRGVESDGDMEFVKEICQTHKIPFDIRFYEENLKGNFQENARKFRYDFFEEVRAKNDGIIALGHHSDDQVETFFMNLMRQSGILGLASIPVVRGNYVRPFLHLSKEDITDYAVKHNLKWREDKSNHSIQYLRNRWRLEFIPEMGKKYPNVKQSVLTLVNAFQETQRELEQKIRPITSSVRENKQLSIDCYNSLSSDELFELWRQLNQSSNLFSRFLELKNYPKGKFIEVNEPYARIVNEGTYFSFVYAAVDTVIPKLKISEINSLPTVFSKNEIYLNPDKIKGELKIRTWQKGDKIYPIGLKGSQSVSQIIRDSKSPFSKRETILVVHDDKTIHWVVGLKISKIATSEINDNRILKIEIADSVF